MIQAIVVALIVGFVTVRGCVSCARTRAENSRLADNLQEAVNRDGAERQIGNNLQMLARAAAQHYLNTGKNTATWDDLVGPQGIIRQMSPVRGEVYPREYPRDGFIVATLPDGVRLSYDPKTGHIARLDPPRK